MTGCRPFNATRGSRVFQFFQNTSVVTLVGVVAVLVLSIACSSAEPTPLPTLRPEPTATPIPTVPPPPENSTGNGDWLFSDKRDPISDERIIFAMLLASDGTWPSYQTPPFISVSCTDDSFLSVSIVWGEFLGFDDRRVDWRVNDEPSSTESWELVGDDSVHALGVSQKLSDLLRADKITARVHRDSTSSLTAEWDTEGFAEVYRPVYEACGQ